MLQKTQGIVLHYIKYREASIIVRIYTRELGLKAYVVNGVRSAKPQSKIALYQPLTLLDMVVYDKEGASLHRISEAKLAHSFQRIPFDFYRSGVAMFVGEVVGKAIYENYQNDGLFDFLKASIIYLDSEEINLSIYPHTFLLQLSLYLGFGPAHGREFFEQLQHGLGSLPVSEEEISYLDQLMESNFNINLKVPAIIRRSILNHILSFYRLHLETFAEVKSLKVLTQMM